MAVSMSAFVRLRRHLTRAVLVALAMPALALAAAERAATADAAGTEIMDRLKRAAHELDYAGIFIHQQGQIMLSSQLAHRVDDSGERQRVAILDGRIHREFLRHNDEVRSLFPELRMVLVERREIEHFPVFFHGDAAALAARYAIEVDPEPGRVAGRPCHIAELTPREPLRWGYRLCVDAGSGLLLKAQTVDPDGQVLEQVAFSEVRIGEGVDPELVEASQDTSGWRQVRPGEPIDLASDGWRIEMPDGFAPISQVRRTLKHEKHEKEVQQMVVSDGIAAISVFIEPYRPAHDEAAGPMEHGATSVYCRQLGDFWITVMGEVPIDTVRQIALTIDYQPRAP